MTTAVTFTLNGEIREALAGNVCRCGTHTRILAAVKSAAGEMA